MKIIPKRQVTIRIEKILEIMRGKATVKMTTDEIMSLTRQDG